jgi:hypothetical protein
MLTVISGGFMQKRTTTAFVLCLLMLLIVTATAHGKEDIQVACYLGDTYIGSIAVFNLELATGNCNALYNDCQGNCFSCYADDNSLEVCIDKEGKRFQR